MIFVYLSTFAVYLYTLYPTISPYRDSGDMITAVFTLGIAHPPGYPLYVLLGKIFLILIPFGNIAYRMNLISVVFGALTCGILYSVIKGLIEKSESQISEPIGLAIASLVLIFTSSMWSLSTVSEMYSLNAFFAVLIIYLLLTNSTLKGATTPLVTRYSLLAFLFGLGLGNHQTLILLAPGILYFMIRSPKSFATGEPTREVLSQDTKHWTLDIGHWTLFFLLGFSIYLFLPVRAFQKPEINWGNPTTPRNLARVLTRADYGALRLHPEKSPFAQSPKEIIDNTITFFKFQVKQITIFSFLIGLFGIFALSKRREIMFFLIAYFFTGPFFFILSNLSKEERTSLPILEPYFILPNIIFTIFIGVGLLWLIKRTKFKLLILLLFIITFIFQIKPLNNRKNFSAWNYGNDIFKTVKPKSLIFNPDDPTTFIVRYLNICHGRREDIRILAFYRTLWGYEQMKNKWSDLLPKREIGSGQELELTLLNYNMGKFPIYSDNLKKFPTGFNPYPFGILYLLSENLPTNSSEIFDFYSQKFDKTSPDFFTKQVLSYYSAGHNNLGIVFNQSDIYKQAIYEFRKALLIDPQLIEAYNNLGIVYYKQKKFDEAIEIYQEGLKISPKNIGLMHNIGIMYSQKGEFKKAEEILLSALKGEPSAGEVRNDLGLVYFRRGEIDRAIEEYKKAIESSPNNPNIHYNLALAFQRKGLYKEAITEYEKYLEILPDAYDRKEIEKIISNLKIK